MRPIELALCGDHIIDVSEMSEVEKLQVADFIRASGKMRGLKQRTAASDKGSGKVLE